MSCNVSKFLAPDAGLVLSTAIEFLTKFIILALADELISSLYSINLILVNVLAATFSFNPALVEYTTVNVVFDGAWPYVLVYKKFDGSISTSIALRKPDNPFPTLSGLGIISSSLLSDMPAPNCNSNLLSLRNLVINRFAVFLNFNKLGEFDRYTDSSGSFSNKFGTASNNVSCAKYGTSDQASPSDSVTEIISTIFVSGNTILSYAIGELNAYVAVLILPDTARICFFNK